jgi:hypothetical protein
LVAAVGADVHSVELTRDERRLVEVREKLHVLRVVSKDDFNLAARYRALVKLEAIMRGRVEQGRSAEV